MGGPFDIPTASSTRASALAKVPQPAPQAKQALLAQQLRVAPLVNYILNRKARGGLPTSSEGGWTESDIRLATEIADDIFIARMPREGISHDLALIPNLMRDLSDYGITFSFPLGCASEVAGGPKRCLGWYSDRNGTITVVDTHGRASTVLHEVGHALYHHVIGDADKAALRQAWRQLVRDDPNVEAHFRNESTREDTNINEAFAEGFAFAVLLDGDEQDAEWAMENEYSASWRRWVDVVRLVLKGYTK